MERVPSKNFQVGETVYSKSFGRGRVIEVRSWIINDFPIRVKFESDIIDQRSFTTSGKHKMAGPSDGDIDRTLPEPRTVTKLEIKNGELIIQYSNNDFTVATLNPDLTAKLIEANLGVIAPEPEQDLATIKITNWNVEG